MKPQVLLHIDRPSGLTVLAPIFILEGWFAWLGPLDSPTLRLNDEELLWIPVGRPDVSAAFPEREAQGFRTLVDLSGRVLGERARLTLTSGKAELALIRMQIGNDVELWCGRSGAAKRKKRQWLLDHLVCRACEAPNSLVECDCGCMCQRCGAIFAQAEGALDFLPNETRQEFGIDECGDISAHPYDEIAQGIVRETRARGEKVLDCGSGVRPDIDETVVCVEVVPYPNVDVLAVNQRLPFRDGSFGAALSLNVLEHVSDPFLSAAELMRVLKPGGTLYCCIPFLQPEHGYPHHYFNATRSGLRQLFGGRAEVVDHVVPRSGEPVWTLHWFLAWYADRLPASEREQFRSLKVADILAGPPESLLDKSWVRRLSEDGRWRLASTTAAVLKKL